MDLAFSIGGDGTFLRTAAEIAHRNIPILGINTGRLGFLADIKFDDLDETLDEIFNGNYRIENRMLLKTNAIASSTIESTVKINFANYSLNEVAVLEQDRSTMLNIDA